MLRRTFIQLAVAVALLALAGGTALSSEPLADVQALLAPDYAILAFPQAGDTFTSVGQAMSFSWLGAPTRSMAGGIPYASLNGIDQGAMGGDASWWTPTIQGVDTPFTLIVFIRPSLPSQEGNIFGKYQINGPRIREWLLQFETATAIVSVQRDESSDGGLKTRYTFNGIEPVWIQLAVVYDGCGGEGCTRLYLNSQVVNNGFTGYPGYVAVEDTESPVTLGFAMYYYAPFQFFKGDIAGGACGAALVKRALTSWELARHMSICFEAMAQ